MFLAISKWADLFAAPLTWALVLSAAGLFLSLRGGRGLSSGLLRAADTADRSRRRSARAGAGCIALAILVLWIFSTGKVGNALVRSLEASAPSTWDPNATYDAVIVLGGLLDAAATESSGAPDYTDAVERLTRTFELLRSGRAKMALISGGTVDPRVHEAVEARVLKAQLVQWGIDPARIVIEDQSRNTRENALDLAPVVRQRRWNKLLLITSAFHMQRAAGCLRAVGLSFDTLPVDFRSHDPERFPAGLAPRVESLGLSTFALHEFLGRLVYRLRGYTA